MAYKDGDNVDILLIEDNDGDVILAVEAFKMTKIRNTLHVCPDAESGLQFLRREGEYKDKPRPDLILLDLNLPKMSGHQALDIIKGDENLREIPTVIMTSSQADRDVKEAYRKYANSYVVKPFGMDDLINIVNAIEEFWFTVSKLAPGDYEPE